jgi:hypothetical protein
VPLGHPRDCPVRCAWMIWARTPLAGRFRGLPHEQAGMKGPTGAEPPRIRRGRKESLLG